MEAHYPYTTLEEKQGILDAKVDETFLRDRQDRQGQRFLVFDDGVEPPFTIPDETMKQAFIVMLGYMEDIALNPASWTKTPAQFLADVKARMGT